MSLDNLEKQRLREATLEYLAKRPSQKLPVSAITRMVKVNVLVDFPITEEDVAEALAVLEGFEFVSRTRSPLGSGTTFQATAKGVVFHEQSA